MNKKATILTYIILVGFVLALALFYANINSTLVKLKDRTHFVGEIQSTLLKEAKETSLPLFFTDQSAKYSAYQSIYDLAENGGLVSFDCGSYDNYKLWTNKGKECYPNIKNNFKELMNSYLNSYLQQYEDTSMLSDNYDFFVDDKKIVGIATQNLEFNIYGAEKKIEGTEIAQPLIGRYSVKPSFTVITDFNLNVYETIKGQAKEIVEDCSKESELKSCVEGKAILFGKNGIEWKVEGDESKRMFRFDVDSGKQLIAYDEGDNGVKSRDIIVKFALHIPET